VTQNRNILNKRESSIVGAIDYQIPVTQLRVLGALRVFWGDRDIQVAKRLFPRLSVVGGLSAL